MTASIIYFSGTGNTHAVAGALAEELRGLGIAARPMSVEKIDDVGKAGIFSNSDLIIFAYPVYGGAMPMPMKRFIDSMPDMPGSKDAAVVCTQMMASGDGAWYYHDEIEKKGFKVKWTFHFRMPNNVSIKAWHIPYRSKLGAADKALERRRESIKRAARKIAEGRRSITGKGPLGKLLGLMQRPAYLKMTEYPFQSPFSVNPDKCTLCMKCVKMCPEGNIKYEKGRLVHGDRCALCMRCYNFCPELAVEAYGKTHPEKKPPYRGPAGFNPLDLRP